MAIALSNSLSKPESTQFQLIKQKHSAKQLSILQLYDQHDRERVLSERLAAILDRQIKFETNKLQTSYLIKTKFESKTNYLWDKCRYFAQTSDSFYVKAFVSHGSFRIGGQLFATKEDQVRLLCFYTLFYFVDFNKFLLANIDKISRRNYILLEINKASQPCKNSILIYDDFFSPLFYQD
jgi:hypothetical protein